jgi:hypothetical protein
LVIIDHKILLYYRDMKSKRKKRKMRRRSRKKHFGGYEEDESRATNLERSEQIQHDVERTGLDLAATGVNILSTPGAVAEVLTRQGRNITTDTLEQSLSVADKTIVASGKVASDFVEQSGNIGVSALKAVGTVGVAGLEVTGELGETALRKGVKPIGTAALEVTGELGETALRKGVKPIGTAAIDVVGTQGENSIRFANRVASSAFGLTNDLMDVSQVLYSSLKGWLQSGQLHEICNTQLKVINLAIDNINTIQDVSKWTNRVFAEGEKEGWIGKKCGWLSCKGRNAIRVVIQSILQTVLFQGENLENISVLKINLEGLGNETKRIKKDLKLPSSDRESYQERKTQLIRKLELTNNDIMQSYNQLALIVGAMKTLAQPNILRLRKGLSDEAMEKSLAQMDSRQKELLKGALKVSNEEIQLMEGSKTRADVVSDATAAEEAANSELDEDISSINAIPTTPVSTATGGRRRRTRKRIRRKKRRKSRRQSRK